eukprot:PITA_25511
MEFRESWGSQAQVDSITGYMTKLLEQHKLLDISMNKPLPTWRNRRVGDATLARRLDRFLIKVNLMNQLHYYKQWVGSGGISDHSPIYLEVFGPHPKPKAPFKFNHVWLQDPEYINMVSNYWNANPIDRHESLTKADDKAHLIKLENQKVRILKEKEEYWHLRSIAIWLKAGDENARFFQNYAKGRKVSNTIWNLPLPDGGVVDTFNKLSHLGTSHFKNLFKNPPGSNLANIINVAGHFPRFVNDDEAKELIAPVTASELDGMLKWFKKDKSPSLDGWTIELYLAFCELLGNDLLKFVEECRIYGSIYNVVNSTFIALIPKSDSPSSFNDFRPISLCNYLYKIICKVIANHLRPILSHHITPQQFSFLEHRQIHEAIGSAHEAIHSIWTKHLKGIILKIYLAKAFDQVSWIYIQMLLIHLGFPHNFISWIMDCITSPTYSVLNNGSASHFFQAERGLRQGCSLSPLLFLIVMDGLSGLLANAKRDGSLHGLKISDSFFLTHLLFVDDVLIFLDRSIRDTLTFSKILSLFSLATGM